MVVKRYQFKKRWVLDEQFQQLDVVVLNVNMSANHHAQFIFALERSQELVLRQFNFSASSCLLSAMVEGYTAWFFASRIFKAKAKENVK